MIQQIHHTALSVKDLDRSIRFYRDLLGMRLDWRIDHRKSKELEKIVGLNDVDLSYAMLSGWGGRIELFQYHSPAGRPHPEYKPICDHGITHLGFEVKSIDAFYQQLKDQGVRFNSPPLLVREGVKAAYFHDPDGITLEIIEYA